MKRKLRLLSKIYVSISSAMRNLGVNDWSAIFEGKQKNNNSKTDEKLCRIKIQQKTESKAKTFHHVIISVNERIGMIAF